MCHTGGKAFKRRLFHSFALTITTLNNSVMLLKNSVLKYKANLNIKFKTRMRYYAFLSDEFLLI